MSSALSVKGCVQLVLADIDLAKAEAVAAALPGSVALHCDVSDHASVEALAQAAKAQLAARKAG